MQCRDPEIYCKFRSACPIRYLEKENKNNGHDQADPEIHAKSHHIS